MTDQQNERDGHDHAVVEMWTDLGCSWCYIGKHRLQAAIARRPDADRFEIRLRSFELNPNAPTIPESIADAFRRSHGGDITMMQRAEQQIQAQALSEGLAFSLNRLNANTFDIHRVMKYAISEAHGLEFFSLLQDRFFAGDINPFDPDQLAVVAATIGLTGLRVYEVLSTDEYAADVRADEEEGRSLGVRGVPFTVFARRYATSGAQSIDGYTEILAKAHPPRRRQR
jgi:predicted DsbA family dithiol-disulfide isomerase